MSSPPRLAYLDSSALVKLVLPEAESAALRAELGRWPRRVTSAITRVELVRACARVGDNTLATARRVLGEVDLIAIDDDLLATAADIRPATLRTLDAIHVASAQLVRHAIGVVFVYDERLAAAILASGFETAAPR